MITSGKTKQQIKELQDEVDSVRPGFSENGQVFTNQTTIGTYHEVRSVSDTSEDRSTDVIPRWG